jgi:hypothetical protein
MRKLLQSQCRTASGIGLKGTAFRQLIKNDIFLGLKKRVESLSGNISAPADGGNGNGLETAVIKQFQHRFGDLFL